MHKAFKNSKKTGSLNFIPVVNLTLVYCELSFIIGNHGDMHIVKLSSITCYETKEIQLQ